MRDYGCLKMWEVGFWGPKHVGSVTFKMLCHQWSPPYGGFLRTWCELFVFRSRFREIISRFREIISRFREIISRFCEIISRFREIISRFREILTRFREILSRFREILSRFREILSRFRCLVHSLMIVRHCVLRNWDRILVRAVRGLIDRGDIVLICLLL